MSTTPPVRAGCTAAMVMLLGGDQVAVTPAGRALVAQLDLSSGGELARIALRESPGAAQRIRLRKACIRAWMSDFARCDPDITLQLIVLGAGLAPLALDWCSMHPHCHAIELDYEQVEAKRQLIAQCASSAIAKRIVCAACDLREIDTTRELLCANGWRPQQPALWVLEGLSYYISSDELSALIRLALSESSASRVILEFSGPRDLLTPEARAQTERYHQFIATQLGAHDLEVTDIDTVAHRANARIEQLVDPSMIEEALGFPRFFHTASASAMRMAILAPRT